MTSARRLLCRNRAFLFLSLSFSIFVNELIDLEYYVLVLYAGADNATFGKKKIILIYT